MKSFIFNTRLPRKSEYDLLNESEQKAYIDRLKNSIYYAFCNQNSEIVEYDCEIQFQWKPKDKDLPINDFKEYAYFAYYFIEYFTKLAIVFKPQIKQISHVELSDVNHRFDYLKINIIPI